MTSHQIDRRQLIGPIYYGADRPAAERSAQIAAFVAASARPFTGRPLVYLAAGRVTSGGSGISAAARSAAVRVPRAAPNGDSRDQSSRPDPSAGVRNKITPSSCRRPGRPPSNAEKRKRRCQNSWAALECVRLLFCSAKFSRWSCVCEWDELLVGPSGCRSSLELSVEAE